MLDDLRNSSSFIDEEEIPEQEEAVSGRQPARRHRQQETFLGMTAQQRFILSLMLFFMVCLLGAFALVVAGKVAIPGLM